MLFKRKKRMIDVRELQRRGVVRLPEKEIVMPTDNQGFVELGKFRQSSEKTSSNQLTEQKPKTSGGFFGFLDNPTPSTISNEFSTETEGYNKREVDTKITDLDNKIYKLEQRIELLERKLNVNTSSSPSLGAMGW